MTKKANLLFIMVLWLGIPLLHAETVIIAHRGASGLAPENTLAAFAEAIEIGAEFFELDVRVSSDDSLMLMHDETINRTTSGSGVISGLTYAQLRTVDAGAWFNPAFTGEKIPTLAEALDLALAAPYRIGVVIEIKAITPTIVQKVITAVQQRNMQDRVIISSFNLSQITTSKQLDPSIPVQLFGTITQANIDQVASIGGEWVGTGGAVTQALLDSTHARGMFLNKWTVNNSAEMAALILLGVDAITTNFPNLAKLLLDTTPPSDVMLQPPTVKVTRVSLNWLPAQDAESGIAGYEIYRDTSENAATLLTTVGDTTSYMDETLSESTTFFYRIKAKNLAGLLSANFSNEVMATTRMDQQPPKVSAIVAYGRRDKLLVEFNERVDTTSAKTIANYTLAPDITILAARLALDGKTVILTTSDMTDNAAYNLTVTQVKDLALIPNAIVDPEVVAFTFKPFLPNTIAVWDLDEGEGMLMTDYSGNDNLGTLMNDTGWGAGQTGNGLIFDGVDDHARVPASTSLNINGDAVSVSVWAKLALLPNELPGAYGPIYDSEGDNYVIYEDKGNNELRFKVATNKGAERPGIAAADLVLGKWLHLVGVYNGSKAMIYMNGQLKDTHTLIGTVNPGQIATIGTSMGSYFKGAIDNIQIFNRAVSEEEINFLYKQARTAIVDAEAPTLINVISVGAAEKVYVEFSEAVDQATAENFSHYAIDNGAAILGAQLSIDARTVILTTSPLQPNLAYTLSVSGVQDMAEEANTIADNSSLRFAHKPFPDGLVSYWLMDEGADTTSHDGAANANTMFLRNGAEWSAGKFGNGLTFDGINDYAVIPQSPSLDIDTSGVSVSVWVKLKYLPADMPVNIAPVYDSSTDNYVIYVDKGNREMRFKVTTTGGAERPGIPAADLKVDEWLHVVGVYDGSSARIYLNGELKDVHPYLSGKVKPGQVAQLGKEGNAIFSGAIDHIQVYRRGLSRAEVIHLYAGVNVPHLRVEGVQETAVHLAWEGGEDPLLGLSGYAVFRDTTATPSQLLDALVDTTAYIDETRSEETTFYYRIKTVDAAGTPSAWFSNEVSVTTGGDTTPPHILLAHSTGENGRVVVHFSEKVEPASATEAAHYSLDQGAQVDSARLALDERSVLLYASGLLPAGVYTLTVSNVSDCAQIPNTITAQSAYTFNYHAPLPGLVAYWPLDEGQDSTAADVTGNGNHAALFNQPTWVAGRIGNGLRFDGGNDYVQLPATPSLNIDTSGVTVSVWLKLDYLPTEMPTSIGPIYDAPGDQYVLYEDKGNKELRFKVTTTKGAERPGIPESKLSTGVWLHIAGVYDGTQAMIYLNGELMDSHPNITGNVKPGQAARLGQDGSNYFKGEIDNVQVYRRGLSADEIRFLYSGKKVMTDAPSSPHPPVLCSLGQNYPNPFNPTTTLSYSITKKGLVDLAVYDLLGRKVAEIVHKIQEPGHYQVNWNSVALSGLPVGSGVYFYRLTTDDYVSVRKMILVR